MASPIISQALPADNQVQQDMPAPQPMNAAGPAPAQTAAPMPLWRSVMLGALAGLSHGGVVGALEGATHPRQVEANQTARNQMRDAAVQGAQADVTFKHAAAAHSYAQAYQENEVAANYSQQVADQHEKMQQNSLDWVLSKGAKVRSISDATDDMASANFAGLKQDDGGAPTITSYRVGNRNFVVDVSAMGGTPAGKAVLNEDRIMKGQRPYTDQEYAGLDPKTRDALTVEATKYTAPTPKNFNEANGQLKQMQSRRDGYASQKDADPEILKRMDTTIDGLQKMHDSMLDDEKGLAKMKAQTKQEASPVSVYGVNPQTGQTEAGSPDDLKGYKLLRKVNETQISQDRQKLAGANDYSHLLADYQQAISSASLSSTDKAALGVLVSHKEGMAQGIANHIDGAVANLAVGQPLTDYAQKLMDANMTREQYDKLSPAAKDIISKYFLAVIGNFADMKNRLGSIGRNPMQLQAEINTIPLPYINKDAAAVQFKNKIDGMKRVYNGTLVRMPGEPYPFEVSVPAGYKGRLEDIPTPMTNGTTDQPGGSQRPANDPLGIR